jgi:hypothetical protein
MQQRAVESKEPIRFPFAEIPITAVFFINLLVANERRRSARNRLKKEDSRYNRRTNLWKAASEEVSREKGAGRVTIERVRVERKSSGLGKVSSLRSCSPLLSSPLLSSPLLSSPRLSPMQLHLDRSATDGGRLNFWSAPISQLKMQTPARGTRGEGGTLPLRKAGGGETETREEREEGCN